MHQDKPDNLDAYLDLGAEDIARLVLCLLIEELLRERLAVYRHAEMPPLPIDGFKGVISAGVSDHSQVSEFST